MPKFLQPYSHLLDRGQKRPRPPVPDAAGSDEEKEDDVGDAVRYAAKLFTNDVLQL